MAASFVPLGYDCVGPDPLRLLCLSQSRCTGKPCDSMILQLCDKWRGIQTHDRRNNGGSDGDQGVALLLKIRQSDSADLGWNCGSPDRKELSHPLLGGEITGGRYVWNPNFQIKSCLAPRLNFSLLFVDGFRAQRKN